MSIFQSPRKTLIMGVVNVTPDSFSDGGKFLDAQQAIEHAKRLVSEGADILDIGGESSRPGSDPVTLDEELKRVVPVVQEVVKLGVPVSIDTTKPEVAEKCLFLGAKIVNDISGFSSPQMFAVAKKHNAAIVIMHMQGLPKTMQKSPRYENVIADIVSFFKERLAQAKKAGIKDIALDPGIGFGKTLEHNLEILKRLEEFKALDCPLLLGTSRKSFLEKITGLPVEKRLIPTIASVCVTAMRGASVVRVHDVLECKQALQVVDACKK